MSGFQAHQSILDSPAYLTVANHLHSQDVSLDDAQTAFCKPIEDNAAAGDPENQLWHHWKGIVALAASISDDRARQKLVDFVLGVARRPDVQLPDGEPRRVQDMALWRDLPIFGWQLREAWNSAASDRDSSDTIQQWINLNAFTARFVASADNRPDLSLYGIWTVRSGLEEQQQPSNTALAAAAVWMIHAAPALDAFSTQGKDFDGKIAKPGSLFSDQEWRGFAKNRWRSWGERLRDVQGGIQDGQTRSLVERAREAMGEIKER